VLKAIPPANRLFFEFLAHTGLRVSEAIGLTWRHVAFGDRPRVLVREQVHRGVRKKLKTGYARRDVPLSPAMARRLWAVRSATAYRTDAHPSSPLARGRLSTPRTCPGGCLTSRRARSGCRG
jgi:integrase